SELRSPRAPLHFPYTTLFRSAQLPLPSRHVVEVLEFVPEEQVDPIYVSRSYYLQPDGPATKPYVLLRDALRNSGQTAVVKVALRDRKSTRLNSSHVKISYAVF